MFFIFFIVSGIAQLFWVVPIIRRWGMPWYYVGIGGTIILIILFVITRMPGNPITRRGVLLVHWHLLLKYSKLLSLDLV